MTTKWSKIRAKLMEEAESTESLARFIHKEILNLDTDWFRDETCDCATWAEDIITLLKPKLELDAHFRELAARFWVHYRCGYVDCEIVEQHDHGGGPAMREMTADELAARP